MQSHSYEVTTVWTGNTGSGTSGYRDYARSLEVRTPGRETLPGSSDPAFRGDPTRWNPELLLLAALGQCHLLSYLHACVEAGVVVTAYEDRAGGTMAEDGAGGGRFTEVVLRPHVTVAGPSMVEAATAAHVLAGERCFIAASVAFPVRHEPTVVAEDGPRATDAAAPAPAGLAQVRAEIDRIDARLVGLLARRQEQVRLAGTLKTDEAAVRAPDRQAAVLAAVRERALAAGLDTGVAEQVWRAMVAGFVDLELREHAARTSPGS
ncbi:chorismate mutase [Aquipuribacter hungaricus]|uniref:Chorismate mutase n=1 Tax=Aquipuribacter hungaricus TaxID=545624 RepID=A0ABV7WK29_9MICO